MAVPLRRVFELTSETNATSVPRHVSGTVKLPKALLSLGTGEGVAERSTPQDAELCKALGFSVFHGSFLVWGPFSDQLPWWRPLRHAPVTSFVAVLFSISAKDSAVGLVASAVQVPESDCPFMGRAVHVLCQRWPDFCADHVPSRMTSPALLISVHDPSARFGL